MIDLIPREMNPIDILGPARALHDIMGCVACGTKVSISTGVLYANIWGEPDNQTYGYAFFCGLTCILEGLEPDGHC